MSKTPWTKDMGDLNKYDWLTAVMNCEAFRKKPSVFALANALMNHATSDENVGILAFPSQETLRQWTGVATTRQVLRTLEVMEKAGAVKRHKVTGLNGAQKELMKEKLARQRSNRAVVYELQMFWACEVFQDHAWALGNPKTIEPKALKIARLKQASQPQQVTQSDTYCDDQQVTHSDTHKVTHSDTYIGDAVRHPNTLGGYFTDTTVGSGKEKEEIIDCGTVPSDQLPEPPPEQSHPKPIGAVEDYITSHMIEDGASPEQIRAMQTKAGLEHWLITDAHKHCAAFREEMIHETASTA